MKKIIFLILIFTFVLTFYIRAEDQQIPPNNTPMYVKYESAWFYGDPNDFGKEVKNRKILYFGNKVILVGNKKANDKIFLCVQLPDNSKFWAPMDYLVVKFIVLTDKNIKCFSQPDESYGKKIKLQTGYLGYYVKESSGFINVDFNFYAPKKPEENSTWIGNVWIKTVNYTDSVQVAEQASYLIRAYNDLYGKKMDVDTAVKRLKTALENQDETVITYVLQDLLTQLESGVKINKTDTKEGNYYTPTVTLRFRESPSMDSKFIRNLNKGEKLKLLEKGEEDTVNGIKGNWCKFETEEGEIGWAFDAYVEEIN